MIKVYVHFNSLQAFQKGRWVVAKLQFVNQYDVELFLDLKNVDIAYQQNGFTIRKKKWYKRLFSI